MAKTAFDRAASATRKASAALDAKGFSTSTGIPASIQSSACAACSEGGVAT
jgi:hypothetical protein